MLLASLIFSVLLSKQTRRISHLNNYQQRFRCSATWGLTFRYTLVEHVFVEHIGGLRSHYRNLRVAVRWQTLCAGEYICALIENGQHCCEGLFLLLRVAVAKHWRLEGSKQAMTVNIGLRCIADGGIEGKRLLVEFLFLGLLAVSVA